MYHIWVEKCFNKYRNNANVLGSSSVLRLWCDFVLLLLLLGWLRQLANWSTSTFSSDACVWKGIDVSDSIEFYPGFSVRKFNWIYGLTIFSSRLICPHATMAWRGRDHIVRLKWDYVLKMVNSIGSVLKIFKMLQVAGKYHFWHELCITGQHRLCTLFWPSEWCPSNSFIQSHLLCWPSSFRKSKFLSIQIPRSFVKNFAFSAYAVDCFWWTLRNRNWWMLVDYYLKQLKLLSI